MIKAADSGRKRAKDGKYICLVIRREQMGSGEKAKETVNRYDSPCSTRAYPAYGRPGFCEECVDRDLPDMGMGAHQGYDGESGRYHHFF